MRTKKDAMVRTTRKRKAHSDALTLPEDPEAPFTVCLKGQGCPLLAVVSIPAADEECMITMEPMGTELEFLPGMSFCQERPRHSKMTLPCQHSFGAMQLLYHMARNQMKCPACRAGCDHALDTTSIPAHFRGDLAAKVQSETATDLMEAHAEAHEEAMRIWQDEVLTHGTPALVVEMRFQSNILLCAYEGDSERPVMVNEFPLESSWAAGEFTLSLSRFHVRSLARNLRMTPLVTQYSVVITTLGPDDEPAVLDDFTRFEIRAEDSRRHVVLSRSLGSNLEIATFAGAAGGLASQMESIAWHVQPGNLFQMLQRLGTHWGLPV